MITYLKTKTKRKGISGMRGVVNDYSYWPTYCLTSCLSLFQNPNSDSSIGFLVYVFLLVPSFLRSFPCFPFSPFPIPHTNHQTCVVNHGQRDEIQGLKIS